MFTRALRVVRPANNSFRLLSTSRVLSNGKISETVSEKLADVKSPADLIGKGAQPGTVPTDFEQATGLERFEYLGKREGIDVFDMENPVREGSGTMADPYLVPTYVGQRYVGCTGKNGESHNPYWMSVEENKPCRCWECGNVFATKYLGEPGMAHH